MWICSCRVQNIELLLCWYGKIFFIVCSLHIFWMLLLWFFATLLFFFLLNMGWFVMMDACSIFFYTTASRSISLIWEGFLYIYITRLPPVVHLPRSLHLQVHIGIGGLNFFFKIFVMMMTRWYCWLFNLIPASYHWWRLFLTTNWNMVDTS